MLCKLHQGSRTSTGPYTLIHIVLASRITKAFTKNNERHLEEERDALLANYEEAHEALRDYHDPQLEWIASLEEQMR